ncbi:MAG: hypothetical protein KF889_01600 [Alphaproteobacteria bacterium]|nr:hypothetical protein [Alphaproteobacteria bacterium]MCW5741601.1 hypothetical protein [Alphaproteobacteria bacterium]
MARKQVAPAEQAPETAELDTNTADVAVEVAPAEQAPETVTPLSPALGKAAPMGSKARAMRDKLASQPKVRVYIPLAPGEKQGVTQSVVLNGYPMYIRKGEYVNVPQSVAEVLEIKLKHKMSIENHPDRIKADGKVNLVSFGA